MYICNSKPQVTFSEAKILNCAWKSAWTYISAWENAPLSIGSFVWTVTHLGSTWAAWAAATQACLAGTVCMIRRIKPKPNRGVQPSNTAQASCEVSGSSHPRNKGPRTRGHKLHCIMWGSAGSERGPSRSPLHPAGLRPRCGKRENIPSPCPGSNIWPLLIVLKNLRLSFCSGLRFIPIDFKHKIRWEPETAHKSEVTCGRKSIDIITYVWRKKGMRLWSLSEEICSNNVIERCPL